VKLPKNQNFPEICLENQIFCVKLPEEIAIFSEMCLEKSNFLTRIHDPQISNQIDATDWNSLIKQKIHVIDFYILSKNASEEYAILKNNQFILYAPTKMSRPNTRSPTSYMYNP